MTVGARLAGAVIPHSAAVERPAMAARTLVAWSAVALVALGFAVRIAGLGTASYWGDEMVSVTVARLPFVEIPGWLAENDPHPPLYYLALAVWSVGAGLSELATRYFSTLLGVLAIPLIGALGIRLFELGSVALANMDLLREAKPFIDRLSRLAGEPSHLGVFNGFEVIVVEREEPNDRPARGMRASESSPAYCTGVGKAVLAFQRPDVIARVIAAGLKAYTAHTITSADESIPRVGTLSACTANT